MSTVATVHSTPPNSFFSLIEGMGRRERKGRGRREATEAAEIRRMPRKKGILLVKLFCTFIAQLVQTFWLFWSWTVT